MNSVSPKLATARLIADLPWLIVPALAAVLAAMLWLQGAWAIVCWVLAGVFAALTLWAAWLIPAQVKRLGWQETDDELVIAKGAMWKTLTVVPYGRIQFVDVTAGPLDRAYGLKKIELHTASASSDAEVPGLPADVADALRERLTTKARTRMSGL